MEDENTLNAYGIPGEREKVEAFHKLSAGARDRLKSLVVNGSDLFQAREKMHAEGYISHEQVLTDTMFYGCRALPDVKDQIRERQRAVAVTGFADFGNRIELLNHAMLDLAQRLYPDRYATVGDDGKPVEGSPPEIWDQDLRIKGCRALAGKIKLMNDLVGERLVVTSTDGQDGVATSTSLSRQHPRTDGTISQSEMVQRLRMVKQRLLEQAVAEDEDDEA